MSLVTIRATLDDLSRVEGKAELVDGRIVEIMPSGDIPSTTASEIFARLRDYAKAQGVGRAYADGTGFGLASLLDNGRESFAPDAAFVLNASRPRTMRFIAGPPDFAVEVRSENDYGPAAELDLAEKRQNYFQVGTQAVWDVDPVDETITLYSTGDPTTGTSFDRGEMAHAGLVLPAWTVDVSELFDEAKG